MTTELCGAVMVTVGSTHKCLRDKGHEGFHCDDAYESARYYDCRDAECYTHESPEEAIAELLDDNYEKGKSILDTIAECSPITVEGYVHETLDPLFGSNAIDRMLEEIDESWHEDYGDPDGDHPPWNAKKQLEVRTKLEMVLDECLEEAHIWQCKSAGKREYTEEGVLALMKEHNPEWFDETATKE